MSRIPRVLFVTPHAFNGLTGGGITFSNLFRGWPKDALATAHNDPVPTSNVVCERYYTLGADELDLVAPFGRLRRCYRKVGGVSSLNADGGGVHADRVIRALKDTVSWIFGGSFPERARLTPALKQWIGAYRPDLLYTILGSNGMMSLVEQIRCHYRLPLVVHIMDDWVASSYRSGILGPLQRRRMERWVAHFFRVAECCLAISPAMCEAYGKRYQRKFRAFQNAIDVQRWGVWGKTDLSVGSPAEVLYIGSIFPNAQLDALLDCCHAVASLSRSGVPITLTIIAPSADLARYGARLAVDAAIRIEAAIEDDGAFFRRIAAADVLLLPVNFDESTVRFIRYSMPTKVPAYLTVGTPILAYGPQDTAQIEYATTAGWGYVVGRRDQGALIEGLRRIITDSDLRAELSARARRTAELHHDAARVRTEFQEVLRGVARDDGSETQQ